MPTDQLQRTLQAQVTAIDVKFRGASRRSTKRVPGATRRSRANQLGANYDGCANRWLTTVTPRTATTTPSKADSGSERIAHIESSLASHYKRIYSAGVLEDFFERDVEQFTNRYDHRMREVERTGKRIETDGHLPLAAVPLQRGTEILRSVGGQISCVSPSGD